MKLCSKILAIAIIAASTYSLIGCAAPSSFSYQNVGITLTAQCSDCPAGITYNPAFPAALTMSNQGEGGTILFTANITNAPQTNVTWNIYPSPNLGIPNPLPTGTSTPVTEPTSSVGQIVGASGNTALYTQKGVPVYSGAALVQAQNFQWTYNGTPMVGIPQGDVLISASVPADPTNPSAVVTQYQLIQLYNGNAPPPTAVYMTPSTPTNPSGLTDSVAFVPRSGTFQFYGGAVGAAPCTTPSACGTNPTLTTDNTVIWQVGPNTSSVTAGGAVVTSAGTFYPYGQISSTGLYTAPPVLPPTGAGLLPGQVVVVMAAHASPTLVKTAYLTIF